jgi:ribosomal protein L32
MYKNNFVASVKVNGSVLRERGNVVYIPFNSYYSIYLKNKSSRRAVVSLEVDGQNVLKGNELLVEGYASQEIFGFMRDMRKTNRFRFIKKTKKIRDYRGDYPEDGTIVVTYRFEKPKITRDVPLVYYEPRGNFAKYKSFVGENEITYTANCYNCAYDSGITVKGEKISQDYVYTDVEDLERSFNKIVLNLRGRTDSRQIIKKPLTVKDRVRCETCGTKNRTRNKFCYNCGTYLD